MAPPSVRKHRMKILLAADGSEHSRKAARQLVKYVKLLAKAPEIHLLHVHAPLPYKRAMAIVGKAAVEKYQREESEAALKVAEKELKKGGVPYSAHWMSGDVARAIEQFCERHDIDLIVMGSHGHTALKGLALGSVVTKVLATVDTPVLIVR
jgi:nucleotide-binding universal stress UspA family protein